VSCKPMEVEPHAFYTLLLGEIQLPGFKGSFGAAAGCHRRSLGGDKLTCNTNSCTVCGSRRSRDAPRKYSRSIEIGDVAVSKEKVGILPAYSGFFRETRGSTAAGLLAAPAVTQTS